MVRTARLRLIVAVGGVMAAVLCAAGAVVFLILTRQLDAAVDAQLHRADTGLLQTVGRPVIALQSGAAAGAAGQQVTIDAPPALRDTTYVPIPIGFTSGIGVVAAARPVKVDASVDAAGAFTTESVAGQVQALSGSVPAGLPDRGAIAAARAGRDDVRTVSVSGRHYRLLTRVLESSVVFAPPAFLNQSGAVQLGTADPPPGDVFKEAVASPDAPPTILQSGVSLNARDRQQRSILFGLAGGGLLGLALTVAGTVFLSGRALAPLQLAFERQQRFIGDAAHELRTPLALVRLEAEALASELAGAERARPLLRQVDRTTRLANDLLTVARLDMGAFPLHREPVHVRSLLQVAATAARRLARPGVGVLLDAPDDLWVDGDRDRLTQVLLNLVDNACRVTATPGCIAISATGMAGRVAIAVVDGGPGIPAEHLPRIFEPFYRVDRARARVSGGTGLGLSIAREIVRAHGGELHLESPALGGAIASVQLPVAIVPWDSMAESEEMSAV